MPPRCFLVVMRGCVLALLAALPLTTFAGDPLSLDELAHALADRGASTAEYQQTRYLDMLDEPLESSGILRFRPPDHLMQQQTSPSQQTLTLEGDQLILQANDRERHMDLAEQPEAAVIATTLRGILNGQLNMLRQNYDITFQPFPEAQWGLKLTPRSGTLADRIDQVVVRGRMVHGEASVQRLIIKFDNGSANVMQITDRVDAP